MKELDISFLKGLKRNVAVRKVLIISMFIWGVGLEVAQAQVCATPGLDGSADIGGTVGGVMSSGQVNTYYPAATNTTLRLGSNEVELAAVPEDVRARDVAITNTYKANGKSISVGDLLLIIQMQDAEINSANNNTYGGNDSWGFDGNGGTGYTSLGNTGRFEYVVATNYVSLNGGRLTFRGFGTDDGAVNSYYNYEATSNRGRRTFQVVRVPQYSNVRLSGNIFAPPFNGKAGGIIAFDVAGTMDLNGQIINADARGFRAGFGFKDGGGSNIFDDQTTYMAASNNTHYGGKGEGIAGSPQNTWDGFVQVIDGTDGVPGGGGAKGAPGNAGGGGNNHNAGGGGGGNGGYGGIGGRGHPFVSSTSSNVGLLCGGRPGFITYQGGTPTPTRLIMGGGGGGGHVNDADLGNSGGVGGGMILLNVGSISGTGTITANGGPGQLDGWWRNNVPTGDGAGGGGAGGTVFLKVSTPDPNTSLTITANGGRGGNASLSGDLTHGPGGGGGGGLVFYSLNAARISASMRGGAAGVTPVGTTRDATAGTDGRSLSFLLSDLPRHLNGGVAMCYPELTATLSAANPGGQRMPGAAVTYTITIRNKVGVGNSAGGIIDVKLPTGISYQSVTVTYTGGSGGDAASITINQNTSASATTRPRFGNFVVAPGGSVIFTMLAKVDCNASARTYDNTSAQVYYYDPTRTRIDPFRRISSNDGTTFNFPASLNVNTSYELSGAVSGTNYDGSSSAADDIVVIDAPVPSLSSTLSPPAIQSGSIFSYSPTSSPLINGELTFEWSRASVAAISNTAAVGTGSISEVLYNRTNEVVLVSYTYTLKVNGCPKNTQTVIVPVNPSFLVISANPTLVNGGQTSVISVSLPGAITAANDITLTLTSTGTARAGTNYVALSPTVTLPRGKNSITFTLSALNANQIGLITTLNLSGILVNYSISGTAITITDMTASAISISSGTVQEGGNISLTVSLPVGVSTLSPLTITISPNPVFPSVYRVNTQTVSVSFTVVIGAGQSSNTFLVQTRDDGQVLDNVFSLSGTVSSSSNWTAIPGTLTVTNSTVWPISLTFVDVNGAALASVNGGSQAYLRASLPLGKQAPSGGITVSLSSDGSSTAVSGLNYTGLSSNIVIQSGANSVTIPVFLAKNGGVISGTSTLTLRSSVVGDYSIASTPTIAILDQTGRDSSSSVSLTISSGSIRETQSISLTVSLMNGVSTAVPLTITISPNPVFPSVYRVNTQTVSVSFTVVIGVGQSSNTFVVQTAEDGQVLDNIFSLSGTVGTLSNWTVTPGTLTVTNSTVWPISLTFVDVNGAALASVNGGSQAYLRASLPLGKQAPPGGITVSLSRDGSSTAFINTNYTSLATFIFIPAGTNSATTTAFSALNKNVLGLTTTLRVFGTPAVGNNYSLATTPSITIMDAMSGTIAIKSDRVLETNSITLTVSLVGNVTTTEVPVTVSILPHVPFPSGYSVDGTPVTTGPFIVTIPKGSGSISFTIQTVDDNLVADNIFTLSGTVSIAGLTITVIPGTLTVTNTTGLDLHVDNKVLATTALVGEVVTYTTVITNRSSLNGVGISPAIFSITATGVNINPVSVTLGAISSSGGTTIQYKSLSSSLGTGYYVYSITNLPAGGSITLSYNGTISSTASSGINDGLVSAPVGLRNTDVNGGRGVAQTFIKPKMLNELWDISICSGQAINPSLRTDIPVFSSYIWNRTNNLDIPGPLSGSGRALTETLTNTTNNLQSTTYTVTPTITANRILSDGTISGTVTTLGEGKTFRVRVKSKALVNASTATIEVKVANYNGVLVLTPSVSSDVQNPVFRWYSSTNTLGGSINDGSINVATGERRIPIVSPLAVGDPYSYYITVSGDNTCESVVKDSLVPEIPSIDGARTINIDDVIVDQGLTATVNVSISNGSLLTAPVSIQIDLSALPASYLAINREGDRVYGGGGNRSSITVTMRIRSSVADFSIKTDASLTTRIFALSGTAVDYLVNSGSLTVLGSGASSNTIIDISEYSLFPGETGTLVASVRSGTAVTRDVVILLDKGNLPAGYRVNDRGVYIRGDITVTISTGSNSVAFPIETDRSITWTTTLGIGGTASGYTVVSGGLRIIGDDIPRERVLELGSYVVQEGGIGRIKLGPVSGTTTSEVPVSVRSQPILPNAYSVNGIGVTQPLTVTIPNGTGVGEFAFGIQTADDSVGWNRDFILNGSTTSSEYLAVHSGNLAVIDKNFPYLQISQGVSVSEGSTATLTIRRISGVGGVTVSLSSQRPSPSNFAINIVPSRIYLPAGLGSVEFQVQALDGNHPQDQSELFVLQGSSSDTSYRIGSGDLRVFSKNVVANKRLQISQGASVVEGNSITLTVRRVASGGGAVTVTLANPFPSGYIISPLQVVLEASQGSGEFIVRTQNSSQAENSRYILSGVSSDNSFAVLSGDIMVIPYNKIALSADKYKVVEGTDVTLSLTSTRAITVGDGSVSLNISRYPISSTNNSNISTTMTILSGSSLTSSVQRLTLSNTVGQDELLVIRAIDPNGVYMVSPISITVQAYPVVVVKGSLSSCDGGTADLSRGILNYNPTLYSYTSQLGLGAETNTLQVSGTGVYQVFAVNKASGLKSRAGSSITVTINPKIEIKLSSTKAVSCGGSSVDLNSYIESISPSLISGANYIRSFKDGRGNSVNNVGGEYLASATGNYTILVTDPTSGCVGRTTLEVVLGVVPSISVTSTIIGYRPFAVDLTLPSVVVGTNVDHYNYYDSSSTTMTSASAQNITSAGIYYIQGVSVEGCLSSRKQVSVSFRSQPTIELVASTDTLVEGEDGYIELSLVSSDGSADPVILQQNLPFSLTYGTGNTAVNEDYSISQKKLPMNVVIEAGTSSIHLPLKALPDKVLYDNDLLVTEAKNVTLGTDSKGIKIIDATALDPKNRQITIEDGTIYFEDMIPIKVYLPTGVTTSRPISVTLSASSRSTLSHLSSMPTYTPQLVTIEVDKNSGEFNVSGSSSSDIPAKLIVEGVSSLVGFSVREGTITILNQKIGAQMSVSDNEDMINDFSEIKNIEKYPDNEVDIIDRWGVLVWRGKGYNNKDVSFEGKSNQGYKYGLPEGIYYYVIRFQDKGKTEIFKGYLKLKRGAGTPED